MSHPANTYSLVADIGGTNTRVALAKGREIVPGTVRRYLNAGFAGIDGVIRTYAAEEVDVDTIAACVAVAGPVRDGRATMTNLDWTIDKDTLGRGAKAETVAILNDLQAQGHALGHLDEADVQEVIAAPATKSVSRLVIGVGTGFNAAPVHETPRGRFVPPCEAGHANLPIRTEAELRLCNFVSTAHGFPAVEDVLSGRGLSQVYRWLSSEAGSSEEYPAAEIMARVASDARAEAAVRQFVRILGTVAGNLTLIHLPLGGVYLVGGVARAMAPHLGPMGFASAFRDKGRFAGFMSNFPVHLILDDFAALTGCAAHLCEPSTQPQKDVQV